MKESGQYYLKKRKATQWYKDLGLLMIVTALAGSSVTVQMGVLPLYVKKLGGSNALSGLIVGMLGISALIFRIPIGYLLDRFGRKPLLIIGLIILVIDFFVLSIWSTIIALFFLRFVQGVGNSTQSTATGALASDIIPKDKIAVGLGYFSIAQSIPQALGPVIGLSIATVFGYKYLFVGSFLIVCIALLIGIFLPDYYRSELREIKTVEQQDLKSDMKDIFKNKMVVVPSIVVFLICLSNSGVVTFIVQYAREKGIRNSGYYFLVVSLITIITRLFSGKILDSFKKNK